MKSPSEVEPTKEAIRRMDAFAGPAVLFDREEKIVHANEKIWEFMGFDILVQIQRQPQWKQNLEATKEKMACKHQRAH